jgi:DNA-binding NarL/FixJ family response regulator
MIAVGIVDRSEVFIRGLSNLLTAHGMRVTGTTRDPQCSLGVVDVSVVELEALDRPYDELCRLTRASRVLLLASHATGFPAGGFRYGAHGIASKFSEPAELVEAVQLVVSGGTYPPALAAEFRALDEPAPDEPSQPTLSDREQQVLIQLSAGLTHGQIARRLAISRHTVDTYVKRIRSKLKVGNKAELTRAAMSIGLCRY